MAYADKVMGKEQTRFGTVPELELELLCNEIQDADWREVIERSSLPEIRRKRDWFTDEKKGYPYLIIPCNGTVSALEIGAGSGVISEVMARRFSKVIALEYSKNLTKFLSARFSNGFNSNVKVVRGDGVKLPFQRKTFDLVVVNGVLEWVPEFLENCSPYGVQLMFLEGVRAVLKDGGSLGVAIENRFYFRHFLGQSPHGEPRFAAVLPRWMGNIISRLKRLGPYRNHIYSYWGYKRLLKSAGFRNVQIYMVLPSYYNPRALVSMKGEACRVFLKDYIGSNILENPEISILKKVMYYLLNRFGLFKFLGHSFFISAER